MTKFYTLLFALIFSFCLSVQAQSSLVLDTIRISGVVVNKKGVGLSAGVFSDTTCSKGTRADEQGRFSMQLAGCQLPVKIIFYLWEYQIREISISQSVSDLRIVMKEEGGYYCDAAPMDTEFAFAPLRNAQHSLQVPVAVEFPAHMGEADASYETLGYLKGISITTHSIGIQMFNPVTEVQKNLNPEKDVFLNQIKNPKNNKLKTNRFIKSD